MTRIVFILLTLFLTSFNVSFGQTNKKQDIAFNFDYSFDKDTATGICSFYLRQYETAFEYPKLALINNIEGRVLVSFNMSKQCSLTNIKIVKGLGYGLDQIARDIITLLGKDFKDKKTDCCELNGIPITLPIVFRIVDK